MNLLVKLSQFYLNRHIKKQRKQKLTTEEKKRADVVEGLRKLYHFVHWLNTKGITNRKQRKIFWRKVINNEPLLENAIQQVIDKYDIQEAKKPKVKIDPKKMGHMVKGAEFGKPRELKKNKKEIQND